MIKLKILDKELTIDEAYELFDELYKIFGRNSGLFPNFPVDIRKLLPYAEPPYKIFGRNSGLFPIVPGTEVVSYGPLPCDSTFKTGKPVPFEEDDWFGEVKKT